MTYPYKQTIGPLRVWGFFLLPQVSWTQTLMDTHPKVYDQVQDNGDVNMERFIK